eukprot:2740320-Rhodomonas_salina.2
MERPPFSKLRASHISSTTILTSVVFTFFLSTKKNTLSQPPPSFPSRKSASAARDPPRITCASLTFARDAVQVWEDRTLPKKTESVTYYQGTDWIGISVHNSVKLQIYDIVGPRPYLPTRPLRRVRYCERTSAYARPTPCPVR